MFCLSSKLDMVALSVLNISLVALVGTVEHARFSDNLIVFSYELRLSMYKSAQRMLFSRNTEWLPLVAAVWRINNPGQYHSLNLVSICSCSSVSIPSATTVMPMALPMATMALTIAPVCFPNFRNKTAVNF